MAVLLAICIGLLVACAAWVLKLKDDIEQVERNLATAGARARLYEDYYRRARARAQTMAVHKPRRRIL